MSYRTLQQWRQRGGSYVKTRTTVAEQTLLGRNSRVSPRQQQDVSDRNGSCANLDLWQRLWQYISNGCDNMLAEQTWLGSSVRNSHDSGKMAETLVAQTWLTVTGSSGGRKAAETSRHHQRQWNKFGMAETAGRRQGYSKNAVTTMPEAQIWICGRGCGKTEATAVTIQSQSKLGMAVASATVMAAVRHQQ